MNLKTYKPILDILILSIVSFSVHKLFFILFKNNYSETNFYYSIQELYFYFFCGSAVLLFVLIKVKEKNIDNVGYTFLLLTSLKLVFYYLLLMPILNAKNGNMAMEKINFFIIFALFLAIDTVISIRLLNKT